jgi:hypothetical protein
MSVASFYLLVGSSIGFSAVKKNKNVGQIMQTICTHCRAQDFDPFSCSLSESCNVLASTHTP